MNTTSLIPRAPVFTGAGAQARLQQLGLPGAEPLLDALGDGCAAASTTTTLHPVSYAGQRVWAETVAGVRYLLGDHGWQDVHIKGVDLTVHYGTGVAIIVTSGDSATGLEAHTPQVKYERGDVVRILVNGELDTLFTGARETPWVVYFFLHHVEAERCRSELSRPNHIGPGGRVSSWAERVLLPEITFDGTGAGAPRVEEDPEIEFDVRRRA
jgi:hypothetical protein